MVIWPGCPASEPQPAADPSSAAEMASASSDLPARTVAQPGPGARNWVRIIASHMRSVTSRRCASASRADAVTL
jgi:hypothetical protein